MLATVEMKKVIFLLPTTFNDGSPISASMLKSIELEIFEQFGGWTILGEVAGSYRMTGSGQMQTDRLTQVWVALPKERINELKSMVAKFGRWLQQEAMYFEVTGSDVELIRTSDEEGDQ